MRISLTVDLPLAPAMGSAASGVGRRIKLGLPMQIAALQSITKGAVRAFWRSPATKLVLFRWTCGMALIRRSRRSLRPRTRTMLVVVPVSSMKTSRVGLSPPLALAPPLARGVHVRAHLFGGVGVFLN